MKRILIALLLLVGLTQSFAFEPKPTQAPVVAVTTIAAPYQINWEIGMLIPQSGPICFYDGGWVITIYPAYNESQIYLDFDFIGRNCNDYWLIYTYLWNEYDNNFRIDMPVE